MLLWITIIVTWVVDRLIKIGIQANFELYDSVVVIPKFFHLTYILNPGAAFGLLAGRTWIFILSAILVFGGIIYAHVVLPKEDRAMRLVLGMIGGGALGNLYDRLVIGEVVDYLDFKVWPYIFNFADSMIVIGVALLVILIFRREQKNGGQGHHEA